MTSKGFTTRLVHADRTINQPEHGAVHHPTSNSVLFEYKDVNDLVAVFQGRKAGHVYSRSSSSSNAALQQILADLEGGVGALTFATGMAAISATMFALLKRGDHIIVSQYLFGNTRSFMETLQQFGVKVSFVDVTDVKAVEAAINDTTRAVYLETIANPVTQVADLAAIGNLCHANGLLYLVDNTMTPSFLFDGKKVQASILISSLTKYFAGHGNVLGGAIVDTGLFDWRQYDNILPIYRTDDETQWGMIQIKKRGLRDLGGTLAPASAHQIAVGMETMALRMEKACENALRLATYLHGHDKVKKRVLSGISRTPSAFYRAGTV